jgi:hypothetical protein
LEREIKLLTQLVASTRSPFGVGFITWSLAKKPQLLDIALEASPQAIMLSFGDPSPFAGRIKSAGAQQYAKFKVKTWQAKRWRPVLMSWWRRALRLVGMGHHVPHWILCPPLWILLLVVLQSWQLAALPTVEALRQA